MSVARHSAYNLAGSLAPIAVSLLTIPPYIAALGEARYGVLAIFGLLLGYFGAFDFGLSAATAQRVAASRDDAEARREIFWTAAAANLALGLIGGCAILPAAWWFFGEKLQVDPALRPEMLGAALWLVLAVPTMLLTALLRGALQGASEFAVLNLTAVASSLATQVVPLVAVWWIAPTLTVALPALFLARLVTVCAMAIAVRRRVLGPGRLRFAAGRLRDLLSFGGWVLVSSLVSPLMTMLDRFAIGATLGAKAVSHYTVPFQLGERSLVLPVALADAIFPRIAGASEADQRALAIRSLRTVAAIMTPAMVLAITLVEPFLSLWLNPAFAVAAAPAARILLAGFWINALGICCSVRLQAAGRPRLIAIAHLIEVGPYLLALFIALRWSGIAGAAAVFAVRVAIDAFVLASFGGLASTLARIIAAPAVILAVALIASTASAEGSLPGLAAQALAIAAAVAVAAIEMWRYHSEFRRWRGRHHAAQRNGW